MQVVPELFRCATYPLTCLLERLWKTHEPRLKEGYAVDPFELETVSMLERALNYAHTGSARVLTRSLMDRAWLSLSVVNDGLPCISSSFIRAGSLSSGLIAIRCENWPVHPITLVPLTASQRSQELTYGKSHFSVSRRHSGPYKMCYVWHARFRAFFHASKMRKTPRLDLTHRVLFLSCLVLSCTHFRMHSKCVQGGSRN